MLLVLWCWSPDRGSTPWHLQHVLVPHDGTPSTSGALPPAAELADMLGAEFLLVHVTEAKLAPGEPGSFTAPGYVDQPQHEWPAWASEFIDRVACSCPLGHLHVRSSSRMAIRRRKSYAWREAIHRLIALAWRGIWEVPRAVTIKDILRRRCPIMVVRIMTSLTSIAR